MLQAFHKIFFSILSLDIPVISLVKSACIGGGCELALFSDFVLASENAYFSQPEIKLGCFAISCTVETGPMGRIYPIYCIEKAHFADLGLLFDPV